MFLSWRQRVITIVNLIIIYWKWLQHSYRFPGATSSSLSRVEDRRPPPSSCLRRPEAFCRLEESQASKRRRSFPANRSKVKRSPTPSKEGLLSSKQPWTETELSFAFNVLPEHKNADPFSFKRTEIIHIHRPWRTRGAPGSRNGGPRDRFWLSLIAPTDMVSRPSEFIFEGLIKGAFWCHLMHFRPVLKLEKYVYL